VPRDLDPQGENDRVAPVYLVHSQLREKQQVRCQRFEKEKSCEGNHSEWSERVCSTSLPQVSAVSENLDDEQCGRGDRRQKKQCHQDSKRGVRVIPSSQQIESPPREQQKQKLRQDRADDSEDDHLMEGDSTLLGVRRGSVSRVRAWRDYRRAAIAHGSGAKWYLFALDQ
jgi:hypothetical protein